MQTQLLQWLDQNHKGSKILLFHQKGLVLDEHDQAHSSSALSPMPRSTQGKM